MPIPLSQKQNILGHISLTSPPLLQLHLLLSVTLWTPLSAVLPYSSALPELKAGPSSPAPSKEKGVNTKNFIKDLLCKKVTKHGPPAHLQWIFEKLLIFLYDKINDNICPHCQHFMST